MKLFFVRNSTAAIIWLVFLQLSTKFAESIPSRTTEINRKSHSSGIVNIGVTRDKILTLQNHRQKDDVKDSITTTNESFMSTSNDFSQLINETFIDTTGLPITEEEKIPFNLAAFNKVEHLAFPLDVDISSLPISHSIGTPLFPNFLGDSEFKSKTDSTTHQIEDSLIDPKREETEPFLTILVNNSPPQAVTESSKPQSSSVSPSDLVNNPLSYLHLRVPIAPSVSIITIAPLPLKPLNPDRSFPSSGTFPENVEISSSVKSMNHSSAIDENKFSNLKVFPLIPPLIPSVTIDFKSPSGEQVLTSDRQYFYQIIPSLLGIGIIYPVPSPTWVAPHSFSTQFQFDQSKFNLATSYGSSHANHPLHGYGNIHRQRFGSPPTPRTLGFPPISNTRDNMRHVVNWARVGRAYRSKNIA